MISCKPPCIEPHNNNRARALDWNFFMGWLHNPAPSSHPQPHTNHTTKQSYCLHHYEQDQVYWSLCETIFVAGHLLDRKIETVFSLRLHLKVDPGGCGQVSLSFHPILIQDLPLPSLSLSLPFHNMKQRRFSLGLHEVAPVICLWVGVLDGEAVSEIKCYLLTQLYLEEEELCSRPRK